MTVSLSGYLPGAEHEGLTRLADQLIDRFEAGYGDGAADVQVVVVGVLTVESVKHNRDPERKSPTAELRFADLEVAEGKRADQLRWVLMALRSTRTGQASLDGLDETIAAMLDGRDDLPPPPPEVIDHRGGTSTGDED